MSGKRLASLVTWSLLGMVLALLWLMVGQSGQAQPPEVSAPRAELRVCLEGPPACDYASLQAAVDAADDGDVVKVAAGVYSEVQTRPAPPGYPYPPASSVITQVVYLSKTLDVRGGYTLTNWTAPDPAANPTILDATGLGRVLFITGTSTPTIESLRLTGGDATGLGGWPFWERDAGGGGYVSDAAAIISDCLIYSNTASTDDDGYDGGVTFYGWSKATLRGSTILSNTTLGSGHAYGGGLFAHQSAVWLIDNTITGNTASAQDTGLGGGLALDHCDGAVLTGNVVQGNVASAGDEGWGGGLMLDESSVTLVANVVRDNAASETSLGIGGGLALNESEAVLTANAIVSNTATLSATADGYGGGLFVLWSGLALEANTVVSNTVSSDGWSQGGGLYVEGGNPLSLTNNVVAANRANNGGSGLWLNGTLLHPTGGWLRHTTIADNAATGSNGQGMYAGYFTSLVLTNTIVSGHDDTGVYAIGVVSLEGTLWHGNGANTGGEGIIITGTVNVYGDPAFVDPAMGDYHLDRTSAAIDTGVDAGVTTDLDGEPRPMGAGYDIGADELGASLVLFKDALPDPVAAGSRLTYTLYLLNSGVETYTATITDALPAYVAPSGVFTWTPPPLSPGDTWTETIVVTVEASYSGTLDNVVRVTTDGGLTGVYTRTVTVEAAIAGLSAANDSPTALGGSTTLTATVTAGSNLTYTWAFDDGAFGHGAVVTHTYPATGTYAAVVTADNNVSELTATTAVMVEEAIAGLSAANDSPTALGGGTTLTATVTAGSNLTYTWAFDDGAFGHGAVVTHTYPATGTYAAVVTAGNNVSELTATTAVTITMDEVPLEGLAAFNDSPTPLGNPTTLTATVTAGSNVTYAWAFGDGEFGRGAVVTHTYPTTGLYPATVTASNSINALTATTAVTITQFGFRVYLPLVLRQSP